VLASLVVWYTTSGKAGRTLCMLSAVAELLLRSKLKTPVLSQTATSPILPSPLKVTT